jgi:hypothetical protein
VKEENMEREAVETKGEETLARSLMIRAEHGP